MGKASKAALEAEQRLADLTRSSQRVVRRQRRFDYDACAELAELHPTGKAAAEAIRAELRRIDSDD